MKETNLIVLQAPFQLYTFMMDSLTCLETINVTEASLLEMAKSKLFPGTSLVTQQLKKKNLPAMQKKQVDTVLMPGSGRSPGEGHGDPL